MKRAILRGLGNREHLLMAQDSTTQPSNRQFQEGVNINYWGLDN